MSSSQGSRVLAIGQSITQTDQHMQTASESSDWHSSIQESEDSRRNQGLRNNDRDRVNDSEFHAIVEEESKNEIDITNSESNNRIENQSVQNL